MEMMIHCPECLARMQVPSSASGRPAQCPSCKKQFIVPPPNELNEETISSWIEDDVDEVLSERDEFSEQRVIEVAEEAARARRKRRSRHRRRGRYVGLRSSPSESPPASKPATTQRADTQQEPVTKTAPSAATKPPRRTVRRLDDAAPPVLEYSTDLVVSGPFPRLRVDGCSQTGVQISFGAQWLEHRGLRMSMPRRCAVSGSRDPDLLARPLAFIDQSQAAYRSASELEQHHEHRVGHLSAAELVETMGLLERMPKPFNSSVLYYVASEHAPESLQCTTGRQEDGQLTCSVLVPHQQCALEWLLRVNGACGAEYELLEYEIGRLDTNAWSKLSFETRQRIRAWFEFDAGEQFRLYLNDADFGARDGGLAGLVLTDGRMVFHKYHHNGSVDVDTDTVFYLKRHEKFADLSFQHGQQANRVAKLSRRDVDRLVKAIQANPRWRIHVVDV